MVFYEIVFLPMAERTIIAVGSYPQKVLICDFLHGTDIYLWRRLGFRVRFRAFQRNWKFFFYHVLTEFSRLRSCSIALVDGPSFRPTLSCRFLSFVSRSSVVTQFYLTLYSQQEVFRRRFPK